MTVVVAIRTWLKALFDGDAELQELMRAAGNDKPATSAGSVPSAREAGLPLLRYDYMGGNLLSNRCGQVYGGQVRMQIKAVGDGGVMALDAIVTRAEALLIAAGSGSAGGWAWELQQETPVQATESKGGAQWAHLGGVWSFDVRRGV